MKILTRDDTDHNTEYVTRQEAEAEIDAWKAEAESLREERDMYRRERDIAITHASIPSPTIDPQNVKS